MKLSVRLIASLLLASLSLLLSSPAHANWLRAESPRFIVYSHGSEFLLRSYIQKLELFDSMLRFAHGMDANGAPPRKLEIYLVGDNRDLQQVAPVGDGAAGFYSSSAGDIFAMAIQDKESDFILLHEYTHHFMLQYFPYGYPAWLIEGYAEYFMSAEVDVRKSTVLFGMPNNTRSYALLNSQWLPMADVLGKTTHATKQDDRDGFYAQAWGITHYFMSEPQRYKQLKSYMLKVGAGADPVASMREVTGLEPDALQKRVKEYVRGRLSYSKFSTADHAPPTIAITELPDAATTLMLPYQKMRRGLSKAEGAQFVKEVVRPRTAKFTADRFADQVLAYGEVWFGDAEAGEAILQRLVAADPKNADALQLLGISRINRAEEADPEKVPALFKEAGNYLAKANAARPNDYKTLFYYATSRQAEPDYPSENTLNALSSAFDLAPQVQEVRILFAQGLMRDKEWAEARIILSPLANAPHGGGGAEFAQKLLGQIDSVEGTASGK